MNLIFSQDLLLRLTGGWGGCIHIYINMQQYIVGLFNIMNLIYHFTCCLIYFVTPSYYENGKIHTRCIIAQGSDWFLFNTS